jgi:predicted transcriptional regulator of viral defense system
MAKKAPSKVSMVLKLAKAGPIRARDLDQQRIPRTYLRRLVDRGAIERVARGLYRIADADLTEKATLAEVAKRHPESTLCLLTALQLHGLTTQLPHEVWLLIDRKARAPSGQRPKLHIVRASGVALSHGVTTQSIDGVAVRVTNPAKTIADCFRYRSHVGLDVALEALREYLRKRAGSVDALLKAAQANRVSSVMRPYVEALV